MIKLIIKALVLGALNLLVFACNKPSSSDSKSTDKFAASKVDSTTPKPTSDLKIADTTNTESKQGATILATIKTLDTVIYTSGTKVSFQEISKDTFHQHFRYSNEVEREFKTICDTSRSNNQYPYHYLSFVSEKLLQRHSNLIKVSYQEEKNRYGQNVQVATYKFGPKLQQTLGDNPKVGEASASYIFREIIQFSGKKFFVFAGFYWEGKNYQVYSENGGKSILMNGIPQVSPDNHYIFTTPFDVGTYFNFNGIELWKADGDALKKVIRVSLDAGTPWRSYWLNHDTIYCEIKEHKENFEAPETYKYCKIIFHKK